MPRSNGCCGNRTCEGTPSPSPSSRRVVSCRVVSPENTLVGGDVGRVRRPADEWEARGAGIRVVGADVASHAAHMDPVLSGLADALAEVTGRTPVTPFCGTVTDAPHAQAGFGSACRPDSLPRAVWFGDAVRAAAEDAYRLFVGIGLHLGFVHTALTRFPPAWHRLDAYIAGRTGVAGIMATPLVRTAAELATRLPVGPGAVRRPM
ncbi:acyltransferase domain-containing protein [Streptomyces nitrosporeus]|uniref:acyltransferase domain-containing protein n=1 Tax=Streptomyces nitrosporeus TaxID=28894 RepID=UPI0039A34B16